MSGSKERTNRPSPLQSDTGPAFGNAPKKTPDVTPIHEKEWDDGENVAGDILEQQAKKPKQQREVK